jgi:ABC-type sugar transport system permease subunit
MSVMATPAINVRRQSTMARLGERLGLQSGFLPYVLILPTLLIILLVAVYPLIDAIRLSLLNNPLVANGSTLVGLRNYLAILGQAEFRQSIGVTLIFSLFSVALETLFGLGIALLINGTFPGRGLVRASILVPWAFPTIVSAQIWYLMYNSQTGIITYLLQLLHLLKPGATLLETSPGIVTAAVITDVWKTTPFMALLLLAGLQVIPSELYEAASVDGSTRWQQFWTITLPMLSGPLVIALLFRTLDAIRIFDLMYILGGRQVETIASYSYYYMFAGSTSDFPTGVAAAVILFLLCAVISIIYLGLQRIIRR